MSPEVSQTIYTILGEQENMRPKFRMTK
jgi:hypothetical protein